MRPIVSRRDGKVACRSCGESFEYYLIHDGVHLRLNSVRWAARDAAYRIPGVGVACLTTGRA